MFHRILIANRGEIACRIIRTAKAMGVETVAVFSDIDAKALHVAMADQAFPLGGASAKESYLNIEAIIAAAKESGAEAVHPGYGFLSENADFVDAVEAQKLSFIGPGAKAIRSMGLKDAAKDLMAKSGVPVLPGYQGSKQDTKHLVQEAEKIGYPIFIKARASGGGKGIRRVEFSKDFAEALSSTKREAASSFGDDRVIIEKYIGCSRHIEVQVFADNHANVVHLFERDCSLQRRYQKVIEEAPAFGMNDATRKAMTDAAIAAAKAIDYRGAGTVEFIVDTSQGLDPKAFWFMEMNTRLQVEHPVTEMLTGIDLVEWQLRVAAGESLPLKQEQIQMAGHAVEARIYAEDTNRNFLPAPGPIKLLKFPQDSRVDSGIRSGDIVSAFYDPMIAKIIRHGPNRTKTLQDLNSCLGETHILGTSTNINFLQKLCCNPDVLAGQIDTGWIDRNYDSIGLPKKIDDEIAAIAALISLGLDFSSPYLGWRHWEDGEVMLGFNYQGEELQCSIHIQKDGHVSVRCNDIRITFNSVKGKPEGNSYQFIFADTGKKIDVPFSLVSDELAISYAGLFYRFQLTDALTTPESTESSNSVIAPMTGVIFQINVKLSDRVKKGDPLIRMEAMKMEHTLAAPCDGIVESLTGSVGATVAGGTILVSLNTESGA